MQFKRILGFALILSLSFVLVACGGNATATPAPEGTEAVDSGDVEATEDADSGDAGGDASADLSESASVGVPGGGTLTVNYPSGWTATPTEGAGSIVFAGSEPTQAFSVTYVPAAAGADAAAVLDMNASALAATGTASEVTTTDNGAYMTITVAGTESIYYVGAIDGGYVYLYGTGVDAATLEAIAASASFSS